MNVAKWFARMAVIGIGIAIGVPGMPHGPSSLAAQEPDRARLGLFLDSSCSPADTATVCERAPVVISVVEDGPAYRAGVRARDTLLAVDGRSLHSIEGRKSLQSLSAGKPVLLSTAGPDGRREVQVIPEIRSGARTMRFEWRSADPDGSEDRVQVFRFPAPTEIQEFELRFDTLDVGTGGNDFVLIEPDSEGGLHVEIADSDSLRVWSRVPGPDGQPRAAWVVESSELARRLENVRDRTLRVARVQLDSLARLHAGVFRQPLPEFGRGRVAGAEFREMTPELAEYFDGQEEGLLVLRVIPETPAGRLGLRGGDIVVEVNGSPVSSSAEFRQQILSGLDEGIDVKWIRKGTPAEGRLRIQ